MGREVAWIAARGPKRGMADIYLDGTLLRTIDLYKSTVAKQRVVFSARWSNVGQHTLRIVNRATAGRPTIDLDAFAVLKAPTDETLVGAGDIARCTFSNGDIPPEESGAHETAQVIAGVEGIVYTTGDNVYLSGTPEEFATCYDATWGVFRDRTWPTPGNHDYQTPGAAGYFGYFGERAGVPGNGFYAYEAGTWRVYALNSECSPTSECGMAQFAWLQADLDSHPHRCVAAYWHRPIFSTGPHGPSTRMAPIFQLLYDEGADLVLAGHDHSYERFAKARPDGTADPARGIRQIVVGTGGAALYAFKTTSPLTEVRQNTANGVLRLDLSPGSYSWEFLPVSGATFTDSGTEACH